MFSNDAIYGSGFADNIYKSTMKKLGVRNIDQLYAGEKHAPLIMPDGKLTVGNYIGPGTQATKRAYRGDRGITPVDDLAMRHDALYSLAKTKQDIRMADEDFLRILKKGGVKDHPMNLRTGELGIASKYAAETITGVKFPSDKELAMNNPNDEKLLNIVRMTDRMYAVQSGQGIMDVLQKIINWLFGVKSDKVPKYDLPEEEPVRNRCKELLAEHGIVDKRSFRRWALKNHPDKVAENKKDEATELFKEVMNCMESEQIGEGVLFDLYEQERNSKKIKALQEAGVSPYDAMAHVYGWQKGEGFSLANFKKVADKYGKISKDLGIKPEDTLSAIKSKAKEKGVSLGSGLHQSGDGFWDFLSVLAVLPIPFFSDVARTISLVATPIRIASGSFTPAMDGIVTDTMKEIAQIFPKEIQEMIFTPASAIAQSVGFGLKQTGSGDVTPMQKVQALYAMVKKIDDAKDKILRLEPMTRDKMINMRSKVKNVADYIINKLGAPAVPMTNPFLSSAYSRVH